MSGGIVRVNKRGSKGYFVASNAPFNDERLSWGARGLMGYLLSKPDGWEARNSDLIARGPAGEHKVKRMLTELKEFGYMHRYRRNADGGLFDWITEIYERPDLNPHWSPSGENHPMVDQQPSGDYPSMVHPSMDNHPINKYLDQLNTDLENTETTSTTEQASENNATVDVDDVFPVAEKPPASLPAETQALATAVADWMGFTGDITYEMERYALTTPALLAWAFWVKVEGSRCRNPVGVCKSKWTGNGRRGAELPPVRWLDLARAWLDLDDNGRLELLGSGGQSYMLSYEFPYPEIMPAFAELYKTTQGKPLPEALLPAPPEDAPGVSGPDPDDTEPDPEETAVAIPVNGRRVAAVDEVWELLLENTHNPGAKTWLTSAELLVDDEARTAVLLVKNPHAADWVNNRLLDYVNREWRIVTRHIGQAWADLTITGAVDASVMELVY